MQQWQIFTKFFIMFIDSFCLFGFLFSVSETVLLIDSQTQNLIFGQSS